MNTLSLGNSPIYSPYTRDLINVSNNLNALSVNLQQSILKSAKNAANWLAASAIQSAVVICKPQNIS